MRQQDLSWSDPTEATVETQMAEEVIARRHEVELYMSHADEMLQVADHNLAEGFHSSAVNRAYYAIFYAANALLSTQRLSRGKHSRVIAAFRQYFVKPGLIETEYSDIYGRVMDNRHAADYEIDLAMDPQVAEDDLADARRVVIRVKHYLEQEGWL